MNSAKVIGSAGFEFDDWVGGVCTGLPAGGAGMAVGGGEEGTFCCGAGLAAGGADPLGVAEPLQRPLGSMCPGRPSGENRMMLLRSMP